MSSGQGARKSIPFFKMQGIGNDFIVVDDLVRSDSSPAGSASAGPPLMSAAVARKICDRRFGVGADQVLWLRKPKDATVAARMEILNADGTTAEMCGNGIRAVGLYLFRHGPKPGEAGYAVETLAGLLKVEVRGELVAVDMGKPALGRGAQGAHPRGERLEVDALSVEFFEVSMGNPHAVIFVPDVAQIPLETIGPQIERHPRFPKRTNVEFVQVVSEHEIRVRVWERGAGVTLACGTGACASAVAALASGRAKGRVAVHLPGGILTVEWPGADAPVVMEGPAEEVFRGEYFL